MLLTFSDATAQQWLCNWATITCNTAIKLHRQKSGWNSGDAEVDTEDSVGGEERGPPGSEEAARPHPQKKKWIFRLKWHFGNFWAAFVLKSWETICITVPHSKFWRLVNPVICTHAWSMCVSNPVIYATKDKIKRNMNLWSDKVDINCLLSFEYFLWLLSWSERQ